MDLKIVEAAGKIAGLGGLAMAVFLLLFMAVIKNTRFFSRMTAEQTFKIVRQFLYLTFVIAALGLGAWVTRELQIPSRRDRRLPRKFRLSVRNSHLNDCPPR